MATTIPQPASVKTPNVSNVVSVQVVPANLTRSALYAFNPGPNVIWVCPSLSNDSTPLAATVAGVGSIPVQPLQGLNFDNFTGALNAIAATGATNVLTIWEYYQ